MPETSPAARSSARPATPPELRIAPSILSADFARLADEVAEVAPAVSWIHVDVMDAHYVDNLTIGPPVVASLRRATDLALDCHLMVADPRTYAPRVATLGVESVTFHPEVEADPRSLVRELQDHGVQVGVALKPDLPLDTVGDLLDVIDLLLVMTVEPGWGGQAFRDDVVPKIAEAAARRDAGGNDFRIQVDGGIAADTIEATVTAGADTFVAGSAVFGATDRAAAARDLHRVATAARDRAADLDEGRGDGDGRDGAGDAAGTGTSA